MKSGVSYNMKSLVGSANFLLMTLDTLRFDVAQQVWREGRLPNLSSHLGPDGWECRHSPASFTYAAHHAFFSGFLPTLAEPGPHPRLYASRFGGSVTSTDNTFIFDEPTLPEALSACGYRTICIGGTGFFNPESRLGQVLPSLFDEAHWSPELGVAHRTSETCQMELAVERSAVQGNTPIFLFINIAAIHQPNWFYGGDQSRDTLETHGAALEAVDRALPTLFDHLRRKSRDTYCIVCSDHGTAYGEDGHYGHRLAHDVIWNVPYAEFML